MSKPKGEQLIKELARKPSNKACFDCGRQGPHNNVNLTANTFVCSSCAGLLRQFNHKVKTISMSNFNETEISGLEAGGNKKARKLWFNRWNDGDYKIDPEDIKNIENFMRLIYERKQWYGGGEANNLSAKPGLEKAKSAMKKRDSVQPTSPESPNNARPTLSKAKTVALEKSAPRPEKSAKAGAAPAAAVAAKPAKPVVDLISDFGSFDFEAPTAANSAQNSSFGTNNGDNSFTNSAVNSSSNPLQNNSNFAPFANGSPFGSANNSRRNSLSANLNPAAVQWLVQQLKTAVTNFRFDLTTLQQTTVAALKEIQTAAKNQNNPQQQSQPFQAKIASNNLNNSANDANFNNNAASTAPKSSAVDLFGHLDLPHNNSNLFQQQNSLEDDNDGDDGNPFGDDSDEDEAFNPHANHNQAVAAAAAVNIFGASPQTSQVSSSPPAAAFFAQQPQYNAYNGAQLPVSPISPGVPQPNPAAQYYAAQPAQFVPAVASNPAYYYPQAAAVQQAVQQQHLLAAQHAARAEVAAEKQQRHQATLDHHLFSGLNPLL
jgi:hypothetical protein